MDDDDTWVGATPSDTDRELVAAMIADTDEWDDTDRAIDAQGTLDTTPQMFEDTGVVIISKPAAPARSDRFNISFREQSIVTFREPTTPPRAPVRAATADEWPPEPREPAQPAPQIRERAFKHAAVYKVVGRPETKN